MELRDLVRQLGRGGGKGPLRRAPEEVRLRGIRSGASLDREMCSSRVAGATGCTVVMEQADLRVECPYGPLSPPTLPLCASLLTPLPPSYTPPPPPLCVQLPTPGAPPGVIRSPLQPEEVRRGTTDVGLGGEG